MTTSPGGDRQLRGGAPGGTERAHVRGEAGPPHSAPHHGEANPLANTGPCTPNS